MAAPPFCVLETHPPSCVARVMRTMDSPSPFVTVMVQVMRVVGAAEDGGDETPLAKVAANVRIALGDDENKDRVDEIPGLFRSGTAFLSCCGADIVGSCPIRVLDTFSCGI